MRGDVLNQLLTFGIWLLLTIFSLVVVGPLVANLIARWKRRRR